MFISIWTTLFVTSLIVCGKCGPVEQTSTVDSNNEKELPETSPTTELSSVSPTISETEITSETPRVERDTPAAKSEMEEVMSYMNQPDRLSYMSKKDTEEDDDSDDDDDDDDDDDFKRREISRWEMFAFLEGRSKRQAETSDGEDPDDEEIMEAASDGASTMFYDYDPRERRDVGNSTEDVTVPILGMLRKRRQSGETVPYVKPNRSRRDMPVVVTESSEGDVGTTEQPGSSSQPGTEESSS